MRVPFLLLTVFIANFSYAQFNDSVHYHLRYSTTGLINKTNDGSSFVLNNGLAFTINKRKYTLNNNNSWIYGRQSGALSNNDFASVVNFDLLQDLQRLYYWGLASFVSSYSLKIKHQFQSGLGIGYSIFNKPNNELVISNGILYEQGDLLDPSGSRDRYNTFRNSLRIKHHWLIGNTVSLDGSHFWQPSLSSFGDYIIRSSTSLSVKLRKWLSLTTAVTYNKISRTDRENLLINFGLTMETWF